MAYTVTIKYSRKAEDALRIPKDTIAPQFVLGESYVDDEKFREGITAEAFSRNIWEKGDFEMAQSLVDYLGSLSQHPGVALALKSAVIAGEGGYTFDTEDYKDKMYYEELGRKLADEGFTITVKASEAAARVAAGE